MGTLRSLIVLVLILRPGGVEASAASAEGPVGVEGDDPSYEEKVRPLLAMKCYACHGEEKQKAGLDLRTRAGMLKGGDSGPAIVPGSAEQSPLLAMVKDREMPPGKEDKLTDVEVATLGRWIVAGAKTSDPVADTAPAAVLPWSFRRLVRPAVPGELPAFSSAEPMAPGRASPNPIDAFIRAKLREKSLIQAPPADKRTLIRRAYFDVIGLPPPPDHVDKFIHDPSPDSFSHLVDELLASPHYGERWGRHWLDVARYADSGGYETDIYFKNAWRYRDYVVKSFNDNKPYDRFVREQVAGDELWPDDLALDGNYTVAPEKLRNLEARTGTGLYALGPQIHESNMDAKKFSYERLSDWADVTGSVFLGLTVGCARCHDHKFDPISQADYYALQATFAGSKEDEEPIIDAMGIADQKQHYPRIVAIGEARRAYRLFEKRIQGRPASPTEEQERKKLLENLGSAVLAVPETSASSNRPFDGILEIPTVTILGHRRPALVKPVHLLHRGDLNRPKARVAPALPKVLAGVTGVDASLPGPFGGRKELALWLTRPDHPLTSRVMVNRIWQWHFGRGIVATPGDFGKMGRAPTHPKLLDWLAAEFVESGWNVKALHRLILLSDAYRMSSQFTDAGNVRRDADNHFFWRSNRRRLEGEVQWDALHAVAGTLNLKMGGPPVIPPLSEDEFSGLRDRSQWVVNADPAEHGRRGLYILVRRNFRFPMFDAFDAPVNSVSCPTRDVTVVAPQALWFLNNQTSHRQARHFAARVVGEAGESPAAWVQTAWRIALGRPPSETETASAADLIDALSRSEAASKPTEGLPSELLKLPAPRRYALEGLCLSIFNLTEFGFVD